MRKILWGLLGLSLLHQSPTRLAGQSLGKDLKDAVSVSLFGQSLGLIAMNVGDKNVSFSLTRDGVSRDQSFSLSLSAKTSSDIGTILSGGSLASETALKGRYAWRIGQGPSPDVERQGCLDAVRRQFADTDSAPYRRAFDRCNAAFDSRMGASWGRWLFLEAGLGGASYSLLDREAVFADQVRDTSFSGAMIGVGINQWKINRGNVFIFGATIGWDERNAVQSKELTESKVRTARKIGTDTTGFVRQEIEAEKTVYSGVYEEYDRMNVNVDLFWTPRGWSNAGLWFFNRWSILEDRRRDLGPGGGAFFFRDGNPLDPIGSVGLQLQGGDWLVSVHGSLTLFR